MKDDLFQKEKLPFNKMQKNLQISHGELVNEKDKMSQLLGTDQDNLKRLARMLEQEKAFNKQINTLEKSIEKFDQDKNEHLITLKSISSTLREKNKQLLKLTVEKQALQKTIDAFELKIKDEIINEIREIIITLDTQKHSSNKHLMDDITRILLDNEGNIPVSIVVKNNSEKIKLNLPFANVNTSKSFEEKLDSIVGLQNVFYKH